MNTNATKADFLDCCHLAGLQSAAHIAKNGVTPPACNTSSKKPRSRIRVFKPVNEIEYHPVTAYELRNGKAYRILASGDELPGFGITEKLLERMVGANQLVEENAL